MSEGPIVEGWISTQEAAEVTECSVTYMRRLASQGRITAQKVGRDWLIQRASVLAFCERMQALGNQRHNPWRADLTEQGLGRTTEKEAN